jgi:hypothetical protein
MNLFEQQALASRLAPPTAATPHESPMLAVMRFIEAASVEQCGKVAIHLAARLFALEKRYAGMKAANLNEAAHFAADAAADINGALNAESEPPCRCGRCDECTVARSDQHHDRVHDALAA